MNPTRIGLDVSKVAFEFYGVDQSGRAVLRGSVRGARVLETFARLPGCLVGLEAHGTGYRWGQQLASLGHEVRLMAPHALASHHERLDSGASRAQVICEVLGQSGTPFTRIRAPRGHGPLELIRASARLLASLGALVTRDRAA